MECEGVGQVERAEPVQNAQTSDTNNVCRQPEANLPQSAETLDRVTSQVAAANANLSDAAASGLTPEQASLQQEVRRNMNYANYSVDAHDEISGASGGSGGPEAPQTTEVVIEQTPEVTIKRATTPSVVSSWAPTEQLVLETGAGDDNVQVTQDAKTGELTVNVNGEEHKFTGADAQNLVIRAGEGNDEINVARGVNVNLIIHGGDGDDNIQGGDGTDRIEGGAGNDTLDGGAGRDYVNGSFGNDNVYGGTGDDVMYGGEGDDLLLGQDGNDYVEGGKGNDRAYGNSGNDTVSGGVGDDYVSGGIGNDKLYTGLGTDRVYNSSGNDTIYSQTGVDEILPGDRGSNNTVINVELTGTPGSRSIRIEGSPEFVERVEADMEFLRSSPTGRQMLTEFDRAYDSTRDGRADWWGPLSWGANDGNTLTIRELAVENNGFALSDGDTALHADGSKGSGADATILYNPQLQSDYFPAPVVVLYHEMSHAYNAVTGTFQNGNYTGTGPDGPVTDASGNVIRQGVPNRERGAVGLDNTGTSYDYDGNPNTPNTTANPRALTENGMREELGLPSRNSYR